VADFDSLQWLLDIALGEKHTAVDLPPRLTVSPNSCACAYILWSNADGTAERIEGLEEIADMPNVYMRNLTHEGEVIERYQYMFVIAFDADNCEEMCKVIDKINQTVRVWDQNGRNMTIYYTDFERLNEMYEQGLRGNSKEDH